MCRSTRMGCCALVLAAAAVGAALPAVAADRIKGVRPFVSEDRTVDVFEGVAAGQLDVKLIVKDSTECRLLVTNKTDRPLNVSLPSAFGGVPVLAQFGQQNNNFPFFPDDQNNNAPQAIGGGNVFGANNGGNQNGFFNVGGQGQNNPLFAPFNIAPEKVGDLKLEAVCLEHGKPEPKAKVAYELKPIDEVTDKPEVAELCRMLGRGELSQKAAQAAAWHLANDMSWDELKAKQLTVDMGFGRPAKPFFTRRQLADAKEAVATAKERTGGAKTESLSRR